MSRDRIPVPEGVTFLRPTPLEYRLADADPTDQAALLRLWREAGDMVRAFEDSGPARRAMAEEDRKADCELYVERYLHLARSCGRFDITRDQLEADFAARYHPVCDEQVDRVADENQRPVREVDEVGQHPEDRLDVAVVEASQLDTVAEPRGGGEVVLQRSTDAVEVQRAHGPRLQHVLRKVRSLVHVTSIGHALGRYSRRGAA
jgi:hypothetical protein